MVGGSGGSGIGILRPILFAAARLKNGREEAEIAAVRDVCRRRRRRRRQRIRRERGELAQTRIFRAGWWYGIVKMRNVVLMEATLKPS